MLALTVPAYAWTTASDRCADSSGRSSSSVIKLVIQWICCDSGGMGLSGDWRDTRLAQVAFLGIAPIAGGVTVATDGTFADCVRVAGGCVAAVTTLGLGWTVWRKLRRPGPARHRAKLPDASR